MPMPMRIFGRGAAKTPVPEDIEARRSAEREFIKAYDTSETDLWYLVDADWLAEWKSFMCSSGTLPGPIRNDRLLDSEGLPHRGLLRVVNYRGVNAAVWGFLQHRYGGGPALPRHAVDIYGEAADDDSTDSSSLLAGSEGASSSPSSPPGPSARFGRSRVLNVPAVLRRLSRSRSGSLKARNSRTPQLESTPTSGSTRSDDGEGVSVFFVSEADASVFEQPMDGSCLFHALSHGLKEESNASLLRLEISKYIVENPDALVAGTPLEEWVQYDAGEGINAYATKMAGNEWGGGIEMEVASRLKGVNVHVFEKCSGGYQRISCFDSGNLGGHTVAVLYQGRNHYDALSFLGTSGKWVPRAQCDSAL